MRILAIFCVCSFVTAGIFAQKIGGATPIREFIFRTKADSILYEKILREISANAANQASVKSSEGQHLLDSLVDKRNELIKSSVGTRFNYKPRYELWEDLDSSDRATVTRLSISDWKDDKLPTEILQCKNLEKLEIINSSIGIIQQNINSLPNLKTIEFYNNRPIHRLRFEKNTTLTTVIMRANGPGKLPSNFRKLKALERLDLSRTQTESIPRTYANKKLKTLLLTENAIAKIQLSWFRKQRSLESLEIRVNKIKFVPGSIKNLPSLRTLALNVNQIAKVSSKIGRLSKLEDLSFYNNNLATIPAGLYHLKALKKLDLYYNRIERLDSLAVHWKNLMVLGLDNNNISSLPSNLGDMNSLLEIYLNNNRLSTLPESLRKLTRMKAIQVNHNYLTAFPDQLLDLPNLENLDISNNKIPSVPVALFDFKKFEILAIYGNPYNREAMEKLPDLVEKIRSDKTFVLFEAPRGGN